jgi:L,D-transpeptidase catalytic domain/Putative peptidoglycan binding domain
VNPSTSSSRVPSATRSLPALAAVAIIGTVVIAGVAGGFGGDGGGDDQQSASTSAATSSTSTVPATQPIAIESTGAPLVTTHLDQPLGFGMAGSSVERLQTRLKELGFEPGPIDGQFGNLTRMAVWAYEKLVLQVPRAEARGIVTDEIWQHMQQPIRIEPRRWHSKGQTTRSHTEVYLPEQVVAFFVDDEVVLISHISSGDGQEWKEVVTIDPGEFNNENGTEPLVRREIGVSQTPGGVFRFDRMVEGLRNSALGGMWDPAYFNYGIAIHGALNVPLEPASHGCIRMPQTIGKLFHQYIDVGDQVFVWDGVKEPEIYAQNPNAAYPRGQLPIFNRVDPTYTTTTTTTTAPPTTLAPTVAPPAIPAPTSPPTVAHTPAPTQPATTTTSPPAVTALPATTSTTVPSGAG